MAVCLSFPPMGDRVRRERYAELIDIIKVLKERVKKERRERKISEERNKERKERREKKERSTEKKKIMQKCDIMKRHLELGKRKRRDAETETLNHFEGSSSTLSSEVTTTSAYNSNDNNNNNNNNNNETTTRKRQLSISEEIEYKHLQLEKLFPPWLLDASAALPPVNLDWLYPDTTKTKTSKEDNDRRRAEKRQRSESISCSRSWTGPRAQYLHEADIFALPYVLPF